MTGENTFIAAMRRRSSAKAYVSHHISSAELDLICEAMSYSPRAGNLQQFTVRVITAPADLATLANVINEPKYIRTCSAALVFFVDLKTTREWFEQAGTPPPFNNLIGYQYAYADSILALSSAALVGSSIGFSTRIVSSTLQRAKAVAKLFKCPPGIFPTLTLTIGKEESSTLGPKKSNLPYTRFTAPGISAEWPTANSVYGESGKAEADLTSLLSDDNLAAMSTAKQRAHPARIIAEMKYPQAEIKSFADNLQALLQENGILNKVD